MPSADQADKEQDIFTMTEFLTGFVLGFIAATGLALWWFHGSLKPRMDALKDIAERSLRARAAEIKAKL